MVCFYGIRTIVGYIIPNPSLYLLTVIFQTIQFSISSVLMPNSFIWFINMTLMAMKGYFAFSNITGASPSDYLVSYLGLSSGVLPLCRDEVGVFCSLSRPGQSNSAHSLVESYPLPRCIWCILQPQQTGPP